MSTLPVPVHGNYHGYYSKRPSVNDPRLSLLPRDLFTGKRVLDVGCNEGWVTVEIAQKWGAEKVVGVDIDETLVRAAWRRRLVVWSQQAPPEDEKETQNSQSKTRKRKRASSPSRSIPDYFPLSLEHSFGPLPVPPSQNRGKDIFPHNLSFRAGDWVKELGAVPEDKEGYDVVLAFSISKWIHLNGGDEGLKRFFHRVHDVLRPGGVFVLEPQPWDTYKKARRMLHSARNDAMQQELEIRPEDFPSILAGIGFGTPEHFGTTGDDGFCRPVTMYRKA